MNLDKAKFIIASGPVIIEDDKVLLNRHGNDKKEQVLWKFPGGKIDQYDFNDEDNSLERACIREVREEMGIGIKIISSLKPMMISNPDKPNTIIILIHYLAKRIGDINPGKDTIEWKLFNIDNLPSNCAPNIKPVVDEYINLKENGLIKE